MSQHPSLKTSLASLQQRSVLKRHERIRILQEKKLWDSVPSIFHLPKVKTVKIKIKKGKESEAPQGAATAVPGATPAAAPSVKAPAAAPKGAATKPMAPAKGAQPAKPTPLKKEEGKK